MHKNILLYKVGTVAELLPKALITWLTADQSVPSTLLALAQGTCISELRALEL